MKPETFHTTEPGALRFRLLFLLMCASTAGAANTALVHARIYTAPDASPIDDGTIAIENGRIAAVGRMPAPKGASVIDCKGLTVTAGFQNSHVHLMVNPPLSDMLTSRGFTTVIDTGSVPAETAALRRRIEAGEIAGPRILTAGSPLYPSDGIPFYLKDLPKAVLDVLGQPGTPGEAVRLLKANFDAGADITKLFTGSLITPQKVKPMPVDVARAAVEETHRRGRLVFAHPSNHEGIRVALASGVDVLVHTTAGAGPWPPELIAEMKQKRIVVIPTLQLWGFEMSKAQVPEDIRKRFVADGVGQARAWAKAGGTIVFGTDVGYMTVFDPTEEYTLLSEAGLSAMDILAALTVTPARLLKEDFERGRIMRGMQADLTVLAGDPASDVRNFGKVRYTIRAGRVIFPAAK